MLYTYFIVFLNILSHVHLPHIHSFFLISAMYLSGADCVKCIKYKNRLEDIEIHLILVTNAYIEACTTTKNKLFGEGVQDIPRQAKKRWASHVLNTFSRLEFLKDKQTYWNKKIREHLLMHNGNFRK